MLVPFIKNLKSNLTPFELYQRVRIAGPVSFFLDSSEHRPPDQRYSYIGTLPFLEIKSDHRSIRVSGTSRGIYDSQQLKAVLRKYLRQYRVQTQLPFFTGGAVGFWSYEAAGLFEKSITTKRLPAEIPTVFLGFYRELIVYDHAKRIFRLVVLADKNERKKKQDRFAQLEKYFHLPPGDSEFKLKSFRPEISKAAFLGMVRRAKDYIRAGDIYQANLSQKFLIRYKGDPLRVYQSLRRINPSPFACFMQMGDLCLVSASPERLIGKRGDWCETRPIAGTRPLIDRKHAQVKRGLLASRKERAEHIMLVDLERNDLGRVCRFRSVKVEEMMITEKYSHVMHIVSKITGRLRADKDALDLIQAVFPGGTITGCPKIRCMQIIEELEPSARGPYTGSLGYLDFRGDLDLNIIIRTLVLYKNRGYLQVGAGIVYDSDAGREYEETIHKGKALEMALKQASSRRIPV